MATFWKKQNYRGNGRQGATVKGHEGLWGTMEAFQILTAVHTLRASEKLTQLWALKGPHFIVCKLYLNKSDLKQLVKLVKNKCISIFFSNKCYESIEETNKIGQINKKRQHILEESWAWVWQTYSRTIVNEVTLDTLGDLSESQSYHLQG